MPDRESQRDSVRRWYAAHAEQYNAERRVRYQADSQLRQKAREYAAAYRKGAATRVLKLRNGLNTSSRVAEFLGITRQTLLNWESKGVIPKPIYPGKHRLYNDLQLELLHNMVSSGSDRREFEVTRQTLFDQWSQDGASHNNN